MGPPGGWTGNGIAAFSYTRLMGESNQNGNLSAHAIIAVTGAARLALKSYPPTVKIDHGIEGDQGTAVATL